MHLKKNIIPLSIGIACIIYLCGFVVFVQNLPKEESSFSADDTDGLIVFTGGSNRIETALNFLEKGYGKPILISGVHPDVTKHTLLKDIDPKHAPFVTIDYKSLSTKENVQTTKEWTTKHHLKHIGIITSYYHIPRSLFYLKEYGLENTVSIYPVFPEKMPMSFMFREYSKYILARLYIL